VVLHKLSVKRREFERRTGKDSGGGVLEIKEKKKGSLNLVGRDRCIKRKKIEGRRTSHSQAKRAPQPLKGRGGTP